MYKNIGLLFIITLFSLLMSSCAVTPQVKDVKNKPSSSAKKAFESEDAYILAALDYERRGIKHSSAELFFLLYQKSQKKEYLYRSLNNRLDIKSYQKVIELIDAQNDSEDITLQRLKIIALINLKELDKALLLADALVKKIGEEQDYILVSTIYTKQEKYDIAVKYLESAYTKNFNETVLDKMAIILYVNLGRKKEAIAQLETHSRIVNCSEMICNRLIGFYSNENNLGGILQTYLRLYKNNHNQQLAKKIVQLYGYKKEYKHMLEFLEESKTDDETLLQLYSMMKDYKKAYLLADKLYQESGDIELLGQSAVFEYESYVKHDDALILKNIVHKLEQVVHENPSPLYRNYLGFVLIDHDLDVKRGMAYIEDVLKVEPSSAYYLDSLAWGHYKLGQCAKAMKIMNRVVTLEGGKDPEVQSHVKDIQKCIKINKGKK